MLAGLEHNAHRSPNAQMNRVILSLACCCRRSVTEISGLTLADVRVGIARPHVVVQSTFAEGGCGRKAPLWWDKGTLDDIAAWAATRRAHGAKDDDPLVCSVQWRKFEHLHAHRSL